MPKAAQQEETIQLYTVNGRKPSAKVPLKRYEAMRAAVLKALHNKPQGLSLTELIYAAATHLPKWWSDEKWDEAWHTTGVKLHLEYLGELERVPGVSPHRVRLAGGAGLAPARAHLETKARSRSVDQRSKEAAVLEAAAIEAAPITMKRPKSPGEMHEAMRENLPLRTGRSLGEWITILREEGHSDVNEAEKWLKSQHGLTSMYAYMIAGAAFAGPAGIDYGDPEGLLDALYSGPRAALRPVFDELRKRALALGPEVEEVVCKTYSSFRAKTQFAVLKPTTQTGLDLGLALPPDTPYTARLVDAKNLGGGERNRHRIRLSSVKEIDAELTKWLKAAYAWDMERKGK